MAGGAMTCFSQRAEVPAVLDWIDRHSPRLPDETVSIEEATGRILATDVIAPLNVPGFDRAAMDGYALRGAETAGASEYNPLAFVIVGQAMPGPPFEGERPDTTDTAGNIAIPRPVAPGQHVGHRGEDIKEGSPALMAGRHLRAQDVGLLA